jgi:hypothetical protein
MKPEHLITCPQNWPGSLLWLPSFSPGVDCGWMPVFAISLQKAPWAFNPCQRDYPALRPRRIWRQRRRQRGDDDAAHKWTAPDQGRDGTYSLVGQRTWDRVATMKPIGETNSRESARPARPSQLIHAATAVTMAASATCAHLRRGLHDRSRRAFVPGSVITRPFAVSRRRSICPSVTRCEGFSRLEAVSFENRRACNLPEHSAAAKWEGRHRRAIPILIARLGSLVTTPVLIG